MIDTILSWPPERQYHPCSDAFQMSGKTGAIRYMAPEVFACRSYGLSADVYSYGILAHEILEGRNVELSTQGKP